METQELVTIDKTNAMSVFIKPMGLDPFLDKIRHELDAFTPDISTPKGRKEVASMAHRVASSKTYIDSVGKQLVAELKEKPKLIDAERRRVRGVLDSWKDEVRQPLTEYENKETARIKHHQDRLTDMGVVHQCAFQDNLDVGFINKLIYDLDQFTPLDESWEEFQDEATCKYNEAYSLLQKKLTARIKYEDEQKELEKLRAEKAVQERKDREARIALQAKEQAEREAAARAKREKERAELRERGLKLEAERAKQREKEAKLKAESAKIRAAERAEKDKQLAIEREQRRIKGEEQRALAAQKAKQANLEHRAKINKAVLDSMVSNGIDSAIGIKIITLINSKVISGLTINY